MLSSILEMKSVAFFLILFLLFFISKGFYKRKINICPVPIEANCWHLLLPARLRENGGSNACTDRWNCGSIVWQKWCTKKYSM